MKKNYTEPIISVYEVDSESLLDTVSNVNMDGTPGASDSKRHAFDYNVDDDEDDVWKY